MFDLVTLLAFCLLTITTTICGIYYKQIKKIQKEYQEARSVLTDIIVSFNHQLRNQRENVNFVTHKLSILEGRNDATRSKMEKYEKQLTNILSLHDVKSVEENKLEKLINDLNTKFDKLVETQHIFSKKVETLEHQEEKGMKKSSVGVHAAIPIKRETVLAPLTETELNVLELLVKEGEKTAPQIKENIGLTREHTARLMKKLYREGYLERDTNKIPYIYRIKDEMKKILKRAETP